MNLIKGVIQAGGHGNRLRPLTIDTPKPLLAVAGVPMIERLVKQYIMSGITDISIITGYLGEKIESHIQNINNLPDNVEIKFYKEKQELGNIGSLKNIEIDNRPLLLSFGDLVTDIDFKKLMDIHSTRGADVTLTSHYETYKVRLGELTVDETNVIGYAEKPLKKYLICSGIAIFNPNVIHLIPDNKPTGISDLITKILLSGFKVTHWQHNMFWMDINSIEALNEANEVLSKRIK